MLNSAGGAVVQPCGLLLWGAPKEAELLALVQVQKRSPEALHYTISG